MLKLFCFFTLLITLIIPVNSIAITNCLIVEHKGFTTSNRSPMAVFYGSDTSTMCFKATEIDNSYYDINRLSTYANCNYSEYKSAVEACGKLDKPNKNCLCHKYDQRFSIAQESLLMVEKERLKSETTQLKAEMLNIWTHEFSVLKKEMSLINQNLNNVPENTKQKIQDLDESLQSIGKRIEELRIEINKKH